MYAKKINKICFILVFALGICSCQTVHNLKRNGFEEETNIFPKNEYNYLGPRCSYDVESFGKFNSRDQNKTFKFFTFTTHFFNYPVGEILDDCAIPHALYAYFKKPEGNYSDCFKLEIKPYVSKLEFEVEEDDTVDHFLKLRVFFYSPSGKQLDYFTEDSRETSEFQLDNSYVFPAIYKSCKSLSNKIIRKILDNKEVQKEMKKY